MANLKITINRSAAHDEVIINKEGQDHTYKLNGLSKTERNSVRELIVNAWCKQNGFKPIY